VGKFSHLLDLSVNISKTVADTVKINDRNEDCLLQINGMVKRNSGTVTIQYNTIQYSIRLLGLDRMYASSTIEVTR